MSARMDFAVVVPWHNPKQLEAFLNAWNVAPDFRPPWLVLQQDQQRKGCAVTKNLGVAEAMRRGAEMVVILDDDCYPVYPGVSTLETHVIAFAAALQPQPVQKCIAVTNPPSRGTPYHTRDIEFPVAAAMGFWQEIGDYDAPSQLVHGERHPMAFEEIMVQGEYFPLCGMNLAFRPKDWLPWCQLIDVPRFDDIWMGWLWQKEAYRLGYGFNLAGPRVKHVRQSHVWTNLQHEAKYLERNETLWRDIATSPSRDYATLRRLLPC